MSRACHVLHYSVNSNVILGSGVTAVQLDAIGGLIMTF